MIDKLHFDPQKAIEGESNPDHLLWAEVFIIEIL